MPEQKTRIDVPKVTWPVWPLLGFEDRRALRSVLFGLVLLLEFLAGYLYSRQTWLEGGVGNGRLGRTFSRPPSGVWFLR